MAILNNTLCDKCKCFNRCDEQYGEGVPPCADLQQLQAKIAALIQWYDVPINSSSRTVNRAQLLEKLRQLSAVQ